VNRGLIVTATSIKPAAAAPLAAATGADETLPLTVRLSDGREITTGRTAEQQRKVHLAFLHSGSRGYVEVAAGRRDEDGGLDIYTRRRRDYFFQTGYAGPGWEAPPLALAEKHMDDGEELFLGVAPRALPSGSKSAVKFSQWLWLDIDGPEHLGRLEALLERKPAHMLVESGGSGGMHAYWRLAEPLAARKIQCPNGRIIVNPLEVREPTENPDVTRLVGYRELASKEVVSVVRKVDPIERANLRLIHALGYTTVGGRQLPVGDRKCAEQSRVLRWAGSRNGKTGNYTRITRLDLWLPAYRPDVLLGDLEDPPRGRAVQRRDLRRQHYDAYRLIPAAVYFRRIAGVDVPDRGNISCPSPVHPDEKASCSVEGYVFFCHGCEAQGTLYDLWSLVNGGPTGDELAQDEQAFRRALRGAKEACRDLVTQSQHTAGKGSRRAVTHGPEPCTSRHPVP